MLGLYIQGMKEQYSKAYLAGGCFWCLEALYTRLPGIKKSVSGYMGGKVANPTYQQVCTDTTGHAEVVELTFDPDVISYRDILAWFWKVHDPCSLNRQGEDVGSQYRSELFVLDDEQERVAQASMKERQATLDRKIVTKISPAPQFWPAEPYHQDYFNQHPENAYCRAVVRPKVAKLVKLG